LVGSFFAKSTFSCRSGWCGITTPAPMRRQPLRTHVLDPRKRCGRWKRGSRPASRVAPRSLQQAIEPLPHPLKRQTPHGLSVAPGLAQVLRSPDTARDSSPSHIARCNQGSEPHEQGYTLAQVVRVVRMPGRDHSGRSRPRFSTRGSLLGRPQGEILCQSKTPMPNQSL